MRIIMLVLKVAFSVGVDREMNDVELVPLSCFYVIVSFVRSWNSAGDSWWRNGLLSVEVKAGAVSGTSLVGKRKTSMAFPRGASSLGTVISRASWKSRQHFNTMDITPIFNQVLVKHNAQPVEPYVFRVEALDDFLQEAYRIVGHVTRIKDSSDNS
jgi:hypothetical protein